MPGYQIARPKNRGGFGWLILLILIACVFYFLWKREHSAKFISHEVVAQTMNLPANSPAPRSPAPPLVIAPQSPSDFPRPVHDVLEAQIALARRAISPGSIDGALGSQTSAAISVFQDAEDLPVTGELDDDTRAKLTLDSPILTNYTVTTNDLDSLQPLGTTWLAKSQQTSLAYETELELVAEKSHSHPLLIQRLNPSIDWTNITAGTVLKIPDVSYPAPDNKAAFVEIHLADRYLEAFDQDTNLILHFPCSIAKRVEKRPVGELHVLVIVQNPNYTVDPELFPESQELQTIGHKLILPPGPRNPVGVAWMGLDKPGYGMHGTPNAQLVGRTESHGCFRLANWDAEYLSQLVWVGMPVEVEP